MSIFLTSERTKISCHFNHTRRSKGPKLPCHVSARSLKAAPQIGSRMLALIVRMTKQQVIAMEIVYVIVVIALALLAILWSQRERITKLILKPSLTSPEFSIELERVVKAEVNKLTRLKLKELAALDLITIPLWEKNVHLSQEEAVGWQRSIQESVGRLEAEFSVAPADQRIEIGLTLRELYWLWLERARKNYASSSKYKEVRNHVLEKLQEIRRVSDGN